MASQIYDKIANNTYFIRQPNLTYRLGESFCSGKISGLEAMKQAIYCILMTERYSNPIYDDNFGVELEKYIGKDLGYISATIETTLREALMQDDRVVGVIVNNIEKSKERFDYCTVEFTVTTIYGEFEQTIEFANRR